MSEPVTFFPDISEFQPATSLPQLPLVIVRAWNGYRVDRALGPHAAAARASATARLWYLYLVADGDPVAQATELVRTVPLRANEAYMVDSETSSWAPWGSAAHQRDFTEQALGFLAEHSTPAPTQYSPADYLEAMPRESKGPVIVADYGVPEPTLGHTAWQYTDGHYTSGGFKPVSWPVLGTCDTSLYHGDAAQLVTAFVGSSTVTPTPGPGPAPTPKPPSVPAFTEELSYPPGVQGTAVRTWQAQMKIRGWNITVDGNYGPRSKATCEDFQVIQQLSVDGVVGPDTWRATWVAPIRARP